MWEPDSRTATGFPHSCYRFTPHALPKAASIQRGKRKSRLTQGEVAERTGVTQSIFAELERFDSNPTLRTLQRYANAVEALICLGVQDDSSDGIKK